MGEIVFEGKDPEQYYVELVISVSDTEINIRELSSYLDLVYRIDGLLSEVGYGSYVHLRDHQIKISRVQSGSLEIFIDQLNNLIDADRIVILWLALKYLPKIFTSAAEVLVKFTEALKNYEDYADKRDRRRLRKSIRLLLSDEEQLQKLPKAQREKLVDIIDEIFIRNSKRVVSASRFAHYFVKSVKLFLKRKK